MYIGLTSCHLSGLYLGLSATRFSLGGGVLPYMGCIGMLGAKGRGFQPFLSEIGYVNWVCLLEEATSSSFGDKTISL